MKKLLVVEKVGKYTSQSRRTPKTAQKRQRGESKKVLKTKRRDDLLGSVASNVAVQVQPMVVRQLANVVMEDLQVHAVIVLLRPEVRGELRVPGASDLARSTVPARGRGH